MEGVCGELPQDEQIPFAARDEEWLTWIAFFGASVRSTRLLHKEDGRQTGVEDR